MNRPRSLFIGTVLALHRRLLSIGLLLLSLTGAALVQAACTSAQPDAEVGSKLNSTANLTDAAAPHSGGWERDDEVVRACLIDAGAIQSDLGSYALVDVRAGDEAARLRIPSAMNVRLLDISNSLFVPNDGRSVVLIGDVADAPRSLRACADAREAGGRELRVLRGGVRAWYRAGGQVAGDVAALNKPQTIRASSVWQLLHWPGAVLVTDGSPATMGLIPDFLIDSITRSPDMAAKKIHAQVGQKSLLAIIVMLDRDIDQRAWRHALLTAGLPEPVFYGEGIDAYAGWMKQQQRITAQAGRSLDAGCKWN